MMNTLVIRVPESGLAAMKDGIFDVLELLGTEGALTETPSGLTVELRDDYLDAAILLDSLIENSVIDPTEIETEIC